MASKQPWRPKLRLQVKSGATIYYMTKFQDILVSQNSWLRRNPHFCVTHSSKKRTIQGPLTCVAIASVNNVLVMSQRYTQYDLKETSRFPTRDARWSQYLIITVVTRIELFTPTNRSRCSLASCTLPTVKHVISQLWSATFIAPTKFIAHGIHLYRRNHLDSGTGSLVLNATVGQDP